MSFAVTVHADDRFCANFLTDGHTHLSNGLGARRMYAERQLHSRSLFANDRGLEKPYFQQHTFIGEAVRLAVLQQCNCKQEEG